ncbi:MAG TPA: amidase, partial [Actinomycetes bacterium]|nr:amidase [Actinomycetes bacterium]
MSTLSVTDCSATQLSQRVARREVSCVEVAEAFLERIAALDDTYHALISRRPSDEVLAEARVMDAELDAGTTRGWMHGLPHAVKDLVDVRGLKTTQGFQPHSDVGLAERDEPFVARIRAEGALFVGKTNTPEFGLGSHTYNTVAPPTGNISDPRLSAGGSSGGAAVAVAAGLVPVADGSDFMGSLRNPPGWNGVLGLRPSPGVVPGDPSEPDDAGLAVDGPIGRTVADVAALLATMSGSSPPQHVATQPDAAPRAAWLSDLCNTLPFEPGILDACHAAAERWSPSLAEERLRADGLFTGREALWDAWVTLRHEAVGGWLVGEFSRAELARMKPEAQWEIDGFRSLTVADREAAASIRQGLRRSLQRLFETYDLLILPTAQVWPFPVEQTWPTRIGDVEMDTYHRWMEVTTLATLAGLPVLAAPAGVNKVGLHIGVQVIGRPQGDDALLGWAGWAEERGVFAVQRP